MKTLWLLGPNNSPAREEDMFALAALQREELRQGGVSAVARLREELATTVKVVARECEKCGAPMGAVDPDDPSVDEVVYGVCRDCWEG